MELGLTGRVAIVAAASKGLGRSVAEELAREGAHVAICARTAATLAETAEHIHKSTGRDVLHQALDVADSAAVAAFVAAVETRFGRLDICVTNSGGPPSNLFKNTQPEDWRAAIDQLLMSTVNNVCPGFTRTERLDNLAAAISKRTGAKPQEVFAGWEREIPAGRVGTPEEFAAVVTFLSSERASYVNGTSIAVDGGLVRSLL